MMMISRLVITLVTFMAFAQQCPGQEPREEYQREVDADIDAVWRSFTTTEGFRTWMDDPDAIVDFRVGGKWDRGTIEHTILCFDPKRMISVRITELPERLRFAKAAKDIWTVYYFTPTTRNTTLIRVVGLGYVDTESSNVIRSTFKATQADAIDRLVKATAAH